MYGLTLVGYLSEGSLLVVRAAGQPPQEKLQVIVSLVGLLPAEAVGARFEFEMEETVSVLEGPLRPWREWSRATDDEDKIAWFMTGVRTWREDGEPRFGGDRIRHWAATVLLDAVDLPLPATARRTRLVSMVATRVGDHELWKAATKLLSLRRVMVMQIEPSSGDKDVLGTLRSWAKA